MQAPRIGAATPTQVSALPGASCRNPTAAIATACGAMGMGLQPQPLRQRLLTTSLVARTDLPKAHFWTASATWTSVTASRSRPARPGATPRTPTCSRRIARRLAPTAPRAVALGARTQTVGARRRNTWPRLLPPPVPMPVQAFGTVACREQTEPAPSLAASATCRAAGHGMWRASAVGPALVRLVRGRQMHCRQAAASIFPDPPAASRRCSGTRRHRNR